MSNSSDLPSNSAATPAPWDAIFVDDANGTPSKPTKAGFLALARHGKDVWNAWRNAYPCRLHQQIDGRIISYGPTVDLRGYDFQREDVSFAGFVFGDDAKFEGSCFKNTAIFAGTQFCDSANFEFTRFDSIAIFVGVQFGNGANFIGAKFNHQTIFVGAQFGRGARFWGAKFGGRTEFDGAQFGDATQFCGANFNDFVSFRGLNWARLGHTYDDLLDSRRDWANLHAIDPLEFSSLDFGGAKFFNGSDFSNRRFTGTTNFGLSATFSATHFERDEFGNVLMINGGFKILEVIDIPAGQPTLFKYPPAFHNSTLHQDTTFQGAIFPQKAHGNEMCARAYRTLKLAFAQQHAVREEQRFFKLEMAEEAALDTGAKRWLYRVYEKVSDYGFSLVRPLMWGLSFTALFAIVYGLLMWCAGKTDGLAFFGGVPCDY